MYSGLFLGAPTSFVAACDITSLPHAPWRRYRVICGCIHMCRTLPRFAVIRVYGFCVAESLGVVLSRSGLWSRHFAISRARRIQLCACGCWGVWGS